MTNNDVITAKLPDAIRRFGLSRATFFILAPAGKVRMLKVGRATLVDMECVRDYLYIVPTLAREDA